MLLYTQHAKAEFSKGSLKVSSFTVSQTLGNRSRLINTIVSKNVVKPSTGDAKVKSMVDSTPLPLINLLFTVANNLTLLISHSPLFLSPLVPNTTVYKKGKQ